MYHSLDKRLLYCAVKLEPEFVDEYGKVTHGSGSGFFVRHFERLFIVTNRHVVDPGYSDQRRIKWLLNNLRVRGFMHDLVKFTGQLTSYKIHFPSNFDEDAAVIEFENVAFDKPIESGAQILRVTTEILADLAYFETLNAGDFVLFPGYPEWHDIDVPSRTFALMNAVCHCSSRGQRCAS